MLSEAVRSQLMLTISFYAFWVMRTVHRGRLSRYEYGVGKIEQLIWVVVGPSLVIAGLWVARSVVATVLSSKPAASPLGLTLAALVNGINLMVNFVGWYVMHVAARDDLSGVFGAQLRARLTMLLSSLFLQATLTVAALAKDDVIALGLDAVGAIFVVGLMLYNGLTMIGHALPDLLDAPAAEGLQALIRRTVADALPAGEVASVRTRRSGPTTFAEVGVFDGALASLAALGQSRAAIEDELRRGGATDVDLTLVLVPRLAPEAPAAEPE
jgi:divalent metal cation (Fe/Co/Zn/Cd) transporter